MNETIKTILTRRSIRKYKSEQIPDDIMKQIVEAGLYAPSAMGRQPCHVVIVRSFDKIAEVNAQVKAATAAVFVGSSAPVAKKHFFTQLTWTRLSFSSSWRRCWRCGSFRLVISGSFCSGWRWSLRWPCSSIMLHRPCN